MTTLLRWIARACPKILWPLTVRSRIFLSSSLILLTVKHRVTSSFWKELLIKVLRRLAAQVNTVKRFFAVKTIVSFKVNNYSFHSWCSEHSSAICETLSVNVINNCQLCKLINSKFWRSPSPRDNFFSTSQQQQLSSAFSHHYKFFFNWKSVELILLTFRPRGDFGDGVVWCAVTIAIKLLLLFGCLGLSFFLRFLHKWIKSSLVSLIYCGL